MNPLIYVLSALGWFVLGVFAGAQWTRMRREVQRIANAQAGEETVAQHQETDEAPSKAPRPRRWPRRILDTFVVLLFIGSAVQAYVTNEQIQGVVACQRAYQTGFADALAARQAASGVEREALVRWMTILDELISNGRLGGDPAAARQRFADATREYLQKQNELTRKQQENPFPPSPRDLCR
jgi:hypothetical protein